MFSKINQSYPEDSEIIKFDIIDWAESAVPANQTVGPLCLKMTGDLDCYDQFSIAVSLFFTAALSRFGANVSQSIFNPDSDERPTTNTQGTSNWTEFKIGHTHHGHSYSMQGATRRLAAG